MGLVFYKVTMFGTVAITSALGDRQGIQRAPGWCCAWKIIDGVEEILVLCVVYNHH